LVVLLTTYFEMSVGTGGKAAHSSPSCAEVMNAWSSTSTRPLRLHRVVLN